MTPVKNTIVVKEFKVVTLGIKRSLWIDTGYVIKYIILENGLVGCPGMDELLHNIKNIL